MKRIFCEGCDCELTEHDKAYMWREGSNEMLVCEGCFDNLSNELWNDLAVKDKYEMLDYSGILDEIWNNMTPTEKADVLCCEEYERMM